MLEKVEQVGVGKQGARHRHEIALAGAQCILDGVLVLKAPVGNDRNADGLPKSMGVVKIGRRFEPPSKSKNPPKQRSGQ